MLHLHYSTKENIVGRLGGNQGIESDIRTCSHWKRKGLFWVYKSSFLEVNKQGHLNNVLDLYKTSISA